MGESPFGAPSDLSATDLATNAARAASTEVATAFTAAKRYASDAWKEANTAFDRLAVLSFKIDQSSVELEGEGGEISPLSFPTAPEQPNIDSDITIPVYPVMQPLKALPEFSSLAGDIDELRRIFLSKLKSMLEDGATGLPADVEQAIWDRALARREIQNLKMYQEAEEYFAARGYELPPGALAARLQEITIEIERENLQTNNDIMINQAQLEQSNLQWAVKEGAAVIIAMMEKDIQMVIDYNKGVISAFMADVERFKAEIEAQVVPIKAMAEIYTAESQGFAAHCAGLGEQARAEATVAGIDVEIAKAKADIAIKNSEINLDNARRVVELQVEALKAAAQVSGQVAASALAAINASASYGFSGGANTSRQDSTSRSEQQSWSWSWSEQQSQILAG
jgi:hypothetical protein